MRLGYSNGSHYWVRFYDFLAKSVLPGSGHSVGPGTNCDIFFYSYWNAHDANRCPRGTILVFISGEPVDATKFRYSLLLDCKRTARLSRYTYYPFYCLSFFERPTYQVSQLIKSSTHDADAIFKTKTKFCAFMYRYDVDFRVKLFDDISRYKHVDALGKSRNRNQNVQTDRMTSGFMDSAVDKYKPYKFVICCENSLVPGYITEKLINGMLANAIPIYYGAPDVALHFNPKSFINISSFSTREEAINFIRRVDQDNELYKSMLREPWFFDNTPSKYFDPNYLKPAFSSLRRGSSHSVTRHRTYRKQMLTRTNLNRSALVRPVLNRSALNRPTFNRSTLNRPTPKHSRSNTRSSVRSFLRSPNKLISRKTLRRHRISKLLRLRK